MGCFMLLFGLLLVAHGCLGDMTARVAEIKLSLSKEFGLPQQHVGPTWHRQPPLAPAFISALHAAYQYEDENHVSRPTQTVNATTANTEERQRDGSLALGFALTLHLERLRELHLVWDAPPLPRALQSRPSQTARICDVITGLCQQVTSTRKQHQGSKYMASDLAPAWNIYNVTYLLKTWRETGVSSMSSVQLVVTLLRRDTDAIAPDGPLLVAYEKTTASFELDHLGKSWHRMERRSLPEDDATDDDLCALRPWSVSVDELGWGEYISSPTTLEVSLCKGECPLERPNLVMNTTRNALMRVLYRGLQPQYAATIPPPCCLPFAYSNIPIVYVINSTFTLRDLKSVTAISCGCV